MVNTFEGLLAALVNRGVRFFLVGGLAVSLNGFVRTTEDMDILVDDAPGNLRTLLDCLAHFGEGFAKELSASDFVDEEGAIRIQETFNLDIFVRMRGKKFGALLEHVRLHRMQDGLEIPYLDSEGLILLKSGSLREKDQIDIVTLKRLASGDEASGQISQSGSIDALRNPNGQSTD